MLIDADNISHRKIKDILDETANYGTPTIKRIYGDFTDPKFAAWKSILPENSITPIQQYAYTTGKNATDSALIIDAEVAKANGAFTVKGYVRFETGEGLEKKNEDFAAEVAAQLQ